MKKSIKALIAFATLAGFSAIAHAQPAVKILVVDMAKLYDNHYKTLEYNAKIQSDQQLAAAEVEKMNKEGNEMLKQYKEFAEKNAVEQGSDGRFVIKNPTLSTDAKTKIEGEVQQRIQAIQQKEMEVRDFMQKANQSLQQRLQTFRSVMLEEITKTAADITKRKGATVLLDKAGPSLIGISPVIYSDPGFDITEEVLKELNKDRPPGSPTAPAPASTAAPASGGSAPATKAIPSTTAPAGGPTITLPNVKK